MSVKSSLPRKLAKLLYSDFIRLSPEQNTKLGFSRKARRYASKGSRITKSTPTISARQHETKRAAELYGLTPSRATEARKQGALSYSSADQKERVAKAAETRFRERLPAAIEKAARSGEQIESYSPGGKKRRRAAYRVTQDAAQRVPVARERKLNGEYVDDGDWRELMDYARRFNDPKIELLRSSPGAYGFRRVI